MTDRLPIVDSRLKRNRAWQLNGCVCVALVLLAAPADAKRWDGRQNSHAHDRTAWPAKVEGHVPVQPGEHPRLFFRKGDLPEIRRRIETPEGQMIMTRLRYLLDGKDGETMTTVFNPARTEYHLGGAAYRRSGTYEVLTVDGKYCSNSNITLDAATVTIIEKPSVSLTGSSNICAGEEAILEFAMRGDGPYTVYYTDGEETYSFETSEAGYTLNTAKVGNYEITKVEANGCEGVFEGEANLTVSDKMVATPIVKDEYCAGDEIKLGLDIISGNPQNITWISDGGGQIESDGNATYYIPSNFDEEVTFTATMLNHCESADVSATTKINKVNALFEMTPKVDEIVTGAEYEFTPVDKDADSYEWSFSDGSKDYMETAKYTFETTGYHSISLTATVGDCSATEEVEIDVYENNNLFIPSVFNPEANNPENRVVKVYGHDISDENFKFQIVNRWGLVVYQATNFSEANQEGWNGMRRGEAQENGVYTFTIVGKFNSGKQFEKTGTITLVK